MANDTIIHNLKQLGISYGEIPKPGGSYVAVNIRGNIAYVAIQFPIKDDKLYYIGRLGNDLTTEDGYEAAKMAATNVLLQINNFVGFERLVGMNHADIYYQVYKDWDEGPRVANGASDLFLTVLGNLGQHTRAIVGVERLPRGFSVAVVTTFTIIT